MSIKERFAEKFVEELHPTGVRAVQCNAEELEAFFHQELLALAEEVEGKFVGDSGTGNRAYHDIATLIRAKANELI